MSGKRKVSRRQLLQKTIAAAGGAALLGQAGDGLGQAPAVVTKRRFKAWISRGEGRGRTTLHEATLRPISGRQVVVRTEATNLCYSNVPVVLAPQSPTAPVASALAAAPGRRRLSDMAVIQGHGGVGIVEAVGPEVRRVQVGDRVCVSGTPQCGVCYRCLRGRSDMCQFLSAIGPDDLVAIADLDDGTPVYENSHIGGLAELMVTFEEWVVPIFTKLPAAEVGMVCSCVSVAGLGATTAHALMAIEPASGVAVVGCGPLGLVGDPGGADRGRVDDHRHRSGRGTPRHRAQSRRHTRARSERGGRQSRAARAFVDELAHGSPLGRRAQSRRPATRSRRGLRDRGRRSRAGRAEGRTRSRSRRAFCRCSRRIRCARSAAT